MRTFKIVLLIGALMCAALTGLPAYAGIQMAPTGGWSVNVEESERQIHGAPTIEVYRRSGYIRCPEMVVNTARSGGDSLVRLLKDIQRDCCEGRRYWNFVDSILHQELIGSGDQTTSQYVEFPYGTVIVIRLGLTELHNIEAMAGTLDDGLTLMPGVAIPGKGWCIAFSADKLRPGEIHQFVGIAVDKSGTRKKRLFTFRIGTKRTSSVQWVPYRFAVRRPMKNGQCVDIGSLSAQQILKYCKGLLGTDVEIEEDVDVATATPGPEKPRLRSYRKSEQRGPERRTRQDIIVMFRNEMGKPLNREVDVTILSLGKGKEVDAQNFTVIGRSVADVTPGDGYVAMSADPDYVLEEEREDGAVTLEGQDFPVRHPDRDGKVIFTFRSRQGQADPRFSQGESRAKLIVKFLEAPNGPVSDANLRGWLYCFRNGQFVSRQPMTIVNGYYEKTVSSDCAYAVGFAPADAGDWYYIGQPIKVSYQGNPVATWPMGPNGTTIKFVRRNQ